jgi:hypothetical protein
MHARRWYHFALFTLCTLIGWQCQTAISQAAVTRIEILETLPYANGRAFENIGPYERLLGRVYFTIDPGAKSSERIVDLKLAPRNEAGLVEYSADIEILTPVDRSKASGTLLYDVNNRGHRLALRVFNEEADEFLMRQGIVVVWSGWLAEVLPNLVDDYVESGNLLRLDAPIATDRGQPITGPIRLEMISEVPTDRINVTTRDQLGSYTPTEAGLKTATLTRRTREADERMPIGRDAWSLEVTPTNAAGNKYCPAKVELIMPAGIEPGVIYELVLEAKDPVVQGLGLAGIRDLVSCLKYTGKAPNPLAVEGKSVIERAIGFGVSQSGRCLRVLLYEGFNADEQGRIVFDGLIPHVAGAGHGFFNHRFCSPSQFSGQHNYHSFPCDWFPFAYEKDADPYTNQTDGLLERARAADVVPKIMHIQNAAEYWHRAGSLVHTDPRSRHDAKIPSEVRLYSIAGAQHSWGNDLSARPPFRGTLTDNPTDYRPHLRAMLVAMIDWIASGHAPPESVYPRIDNGTLVDWHAAASPWQALPGVEYPGVIHQPELLDFGPLFASQGISTIQPPKQLKRYPVLVPAVDADNNELGMLRLPFLRVPIATYTGWNLRGEKIGAAGELMSLKGSYIPFAATKAAREKAGDPRLSLAERYASPEEYLVRLQAAIDALVEERHLLAEDAPRLMERGKKMAEVIGINDEVPNDE